MPIHWPVCSAACLLDAALLRLTYLTGGAGLGGTLSQLPIITTVVITPALAELQWLITVEAFACASTISFKRIAPQRCSCMSDHLLDRMRSMDDNALASVLLACSMTLVSLSTCSALVIGWHSYSHSFAYQSKPAWKPACLAKRNI